MPSYNASCWNEGETRKIKCTVLVVPYQIYIHENGNTGSIAHPRFLGSNGACAIASNEYLMLLFTAVSPEQYHDWAAHTENGLGMISHIANFYNRRWLLFFVAD